jgi:type I restriction enzyme M protein
VSLDEIRSGGYALTPGRYVSAPAAVDDAEPVDDKIARLTKDLLEALDESARQDVVVREQVERLR